MRAFRSCRVSRESVLVDSLPQNGHIYGLLPLGLDRREHKPSRNTSVEILFRDIDRRRQLNDPHQSVKVVRMPDSPIPQFGRSP